MTDENNPTDPDDEWCDEAILEIFRQQIDELERARDLLSKSGKPADDNPKLLNVIGNLRLIRQMADELARELEG